MTSVSTDRRQGITASAAVKVPCKAATTANITLSGEQTIDGVACVTGDRVLVKDQTSGVDNGIYIVDTSTWDRSPDWDGALDVKKGTLVFVNSGTTNLGWLYVSTSDPITPGTTSVTIGRASSILAVVSTFAQTLLDDTTASAFLTTLGMSTFFQTLIDETTAAATVDALAAPRNFSRSVSASPTTVSNTITETTVYTVSLTGFSTTFGQRSAILELQGQYLNNDGAARALTVRVKHYGTTIAVFDGFSAIPASASLRGVYLKTVINGDVANGTAYASSEFRLGGAVGITGADSTIDGVATENGSLQAQYNSFAAPSGTLTLEVTVQHGTASSNISFSKYFARVQVE